MNFICKISESIFNKYWFTENELGIKSAIDLKELESIYCLCDVNHWSSSEQLSDMSKFWCCSRTPCKESKRKNKGKILSINFEKHFQKLIEFARQIDDDNEFVFSGKQKLATRANASTKRTSYFGVSKNGPNKQTLISIIKNKTYVGTFATESEAGAAFDFYSMLLHRSRALTNFTYTKEQIENLIERFRSTISPKS